MNAREQAIDAIIRFVEAVDDGDEEALASSLTEDMTLDLTPLNQSGMNYSILEGRDTVVQRLMAAVGTSMDTTHMLSNFRVSVHGDSADLRCCVLAQHFKKGEGRLTAAKDYYLMGNRYQGTIVRAEKVWQIRELVVTPTWTEGNADVMKVG